MTAALLCLLTGALMLVEQTVEGVEAGHPNPLTGHVPVNYQHADLNRDGFVDLILRDRVLLQRGGEFPQVLSVALPKAEARPEYDVFDDLLYLRLPGRLEIHQLDNLRWERVFRQSLEWPDMSRDNDRRLADERLGVGYAAPRRYLHDFSGDGVPEIVLATPDGLYVYARMTVAYGRVALLDVLPHRRVRLLEKTPIWPARERKLGLPTTYLGCRLFMEGDTLTVLSRILSTSEGVNHRTLRWRVDPDDGYSLVREEETLSDTPPLPGFLRPCRLNGDSIQDYAGVRLLFTENSLLPERIYEIAATTDGGETVQRFRSKSFPTLAAFMDVDGDGDLDAVVESTGLYDGGLREYLARSISDRRIRHTISIHLQDSSGRFSERADTRYGVTIELARVPVRNGPLFRQYRAGSLVNLTGDLNGDGLRDLVVRTHPDRVGIFLNDGNSFPKKPDATVSVELETRFAVTDVNGDGLSDILVQADLAGAAQAPATVHFSIMDAR